MGIWTTSVLLPSTAASAAGAQSLTLARDCVAAQIEASGSASLMFAQRPSAFRAATRPLRTGGPPATFLRLADSIAARFDARAAGLPESERRSVHRRLERMRQEMASAQRPSAIFRITSNATDDAFVIFANQPDSIVIAEARPQPQRRALCWAMLEADDLASDFSLADRRAFASFLDARVQRWENFHERGYSMLPFELLLNSWLGERWAPLRRPVLEPPAEQVIFLHPSIALEVPVKDISWSVHGRDAMVLEPLGYIRYNADRTRYWGISTAASLTVGDEPGWGAVIHLGRLRHIGYLYRQDPSEERREHVVTISADLLKGVLGRATMYRSEVEGLRQRIALCAQNLPECLAPATAPR